jgi:ribonucleoside-diphosphate reductase alpha chain
MYWRVAKAIAAVEKPEIRNSWTIIFYNMMSQNIFLPNSPTLMNAGRRLGMLSACFVLPVNDDLDDIFDSVKATALVQRAGGGTGFNFSNLRPSGSIVKSSGGTTAGPLSFIDVFSQATNTIQQGAFRRGANMGILNVDHPDIISFIKAKSDLKRWQNYNISVAVTSAFMDAVGSTPMQHHAVQHPEWGTGHLYKNDATGEVVAFTSNKSNPTGFSKWTVGDTWKLICTRAWETGEPGLFFIEQANKNNPVAHLGKIEATNPCGEQPLHAYDSCNLGSINLAKFFKPTKNCTSGINAFDSDSFKSIVSYAVRFLDNVIDANNYPLLEIEEMSKKTRRIGLGVMGFADLLFKMKIPYNSNEAYKLAREIGLQLSNYAYEASHLLALEKGCFKAWEKSSYQNTSMRNAFRTTVAPTGTISIIADCSSGIEPLFALSFKRTVMPDDKGNFKEMWETNKEFLEAIGLLDVPSTRDRLLNHVKAHGTIANYTPCAGDRGVEVHNIQDIFLTSHDIDPISHVKMQEAWQKYIDTAISKTINLPHDADVKVVMDSYWEAYLGNLKGITVYRDGCRNNVAGMKQPMSVEKQEPKDGNQKSSEKVNSVAMEPLSSNNVRSINTLRNNNKYRLARRTQVRSQFGNIHVFITYGDSGKPTEIFAQLGKAGDLISADTEAICRLASKLLSSGTTIEEVLTQLEGIGSVNAYLGPSGRISSLPEAIAMGIRQIIGDEEEENSTITNSDKTTTLMRVKCPECSGILSFQEGCQKCASCGYSAC